MPTASILLFIFLIISEITHAQSPRLMLPIGHFEGIHSACFSPDEKRIVTASSDGDAKIWDANSGYLLANLQGHTKGVNTVAYSPDGSRIITASDDQTVRIWNTLTGQLKRILKGHQGRVLKAVFTKEGKKAISISGDGTVRIWNGDTGSLLNTIKNHSGSLNTVAFDEDMKEMLTASAGNSVGVWDIERGILVRTLKGHTGPIDFIAYSPGGTQVITCSRDKTAKIWDARTGKLVAALKGHDEQINFAVYSKDEKKIITCSEDKTAKVWDGHTGAFQFSLETYDTPVSAGFSPDGKKIVTSSLSSVSIWNSDDGGLLPSPEVAFLHDDFRSAWVSAYFTPDGSKVIITGENGGVRIWDMNREELDSHVISHDEHVSSLFFNENGSKFVTTSDDKTARIWDTRSGTIIQQLKSFTPFASLSFYTPDQQRIIVQYDDSLVRVWDAEKGIVSFTFKHGYKVDQVTISPDGRKIITISDDDLAIVWDAGTGDRLYNLEGHGGKIKSAEFSHDGLQIVTIARYDNTMRIWDTYTGELLTSIGLDKIMGHPETAIFSLDKKKIIITSGVNDVHVLEIESGELLFELENEFTHLNRWNVIALHPDNKRIAIAASNGVIELRELTSGKLLSTLKGHTRQINSIFFSADGKSLLTASYDQTARIWDAGQGKLLTTFRGHTGNVRSAFFSHDEKRILTASEDFTAKVWDARSGKLISNLEGHTGWIHTAFFSPDDRKVVTTSGDHTSKIWNVNDGSLIYTFFPVDSSGYFLQVPGGYYQSTTNASKLLHYVTKDLKVISFEQLDVRYNRPDKVLETIGNPDTSLISSYRKAWQKRIRKLGIDTTAFREGNSVPESDFKNRDAIAYEQANGTITLHIMSRDSVYALDRFNIWVNEVPVFGQRGFNLRSNKRYDLDTTITISLSQGINRLETSVTNVNGTESYRMPLLLNYTPAVKQKETLHFIGIGIDQFSDNRYNLQFSSKDIRDLAARLKEKYKNEIRIDTLFNEQVTTQNIQALKERLQQASVNDKVIISYSGHGLLSSDFNYYLSTYGVNFDKPEENGLPYEELENLLDSIPARKKLLLIDACHSGEVDKEDLVTMNTSPDSLIKGLKPVAYKKDGQLGLKNSFELMQSLFVNVGKSTGATIISAAAGTQFALERNDLKNGVFTYSILEAMNTYPILKISELKKIVGARVEELTGGLQKPTSRNETIAVDWEVW